MRITRRAALAGALLPFAARAQTPEWPSRPVRFIVPYPPGGPTDIMGRIVAQAVQGPLGQPFVVENRAGANGLIGSEQAARAAPDGSTFLVNASAHVIVPHLTPNMPIDVLADFAPVTNIAAVPLWLVVNPALPVRSVAEFIAYARANPGRIAYASSSQGGAPHLAGELFRLMTGTDLVHVPYRGSGPAGQDLIAGTVQAMFDSVPASAGAVRDGRLRALGVTTRNRIAPFPDLPTIAEAGVPGYEISTWYGIWAPARTPPNNIARLQQAVASAARNPETRARFDALGAEPVADSPEDYARFVRAEYDRWGKLVRDAKIKLD
ncbi:MAG: tripartite tricarboxylate transporter substrate binding protein [Roseomonas sp.]|nr:tripartite tricarboxylate transporter substrate binding protein [Roseomonas sp.]MCA3326984.1 tripartite tricarboxylate transporter substrate binding protein [Roseomonas sp.]MCA3330898.1 tripartite tricarboxylate transporter substrate binding protein [Roseomonas sp.]MCA3333981.1 tripartite tricarboxylate transporter substrate binding protein [Roseomonas sp.]MCA3346872.1 tripartite tricarboxylate transporter substrate binding protein [Roseomonas sp.]